MNKLRTASKMPNRSAVAGSSTDICSRSANSGIDIMQFVSCTKFEATTCSSMFVNVNLKRKLYHNISYFICTIIHSISSNTRFSVAASLFRQCRCNAEDSFVEHESSIYNRHMLNLTLAHLSSCYLKRMGGYRFY